jgi:hypothetical protein
MKILAVYFNHIKDKILYKPILVIKQDSVYHAYDLYGVFNAKIKIYSTIECVKLKNIKPRFYELVIKFIFGEHVSIADYNEYQTFEVEVE